MGCIWRLGSSPRARMGVKVVRFAGSREHPYLLQTALSVQSFSVCLIFLFFLVEGGIFFFLLITHFTVIVVGGDSGDDDGLCGSGGGVCVPVVWLQRRWPGFLPALFGRCARI